MNVRTCSETADHELTIHLEDQGQSSFSKKMNFFPSLERRASFGTILDRRKNHTGNPSMMGRYAVKYVEEKCLFFINQTMSIILYLVILGYFHNIVLRYFFAQYRTALNSE